MAIQVMTVLEARVPRDRWDDLRAAFAQGQGRLPRQMVHSYLMQSGAEPELWRTVGVWESHMALDEYRHSVETPGGVLFFRAAGAEPTLAIFDIVTQQSRPAAAGG